MSKARDLASATPAPSTVSATELGYVDGVTSAIQTQIDSKQAVVSGVNDTEIGYLDGVTSAIQTQINAQIPKSIVDAKGDIIAATAADTVNKLTVGANDTVLTADSSTATGLKWAAPSSPTIQVASFAEYQNSGTAGGTSINNEWTKRVLNTTLINTITNCTLTSSVISLPAGTYTIVANSSFVDTDGVQIKLRNTTDSTNTIFGTVGWSLDGNTDPVCTLVGSFTIAGTKNFEIQYLLDMPKTTDGLGRNLNFGTSNCYTNCLITKVA